MSPQPPSHRRLIVTILSVTAGMFAFAVFLLPPLYDVFCDITGLNGKITAGNWDRSGRQPIGQLTDSETSSGQVTVQFVTHVDGDMASEFSPVIRSVKMTPGSTQRVDFLVTNLSEQQIVAQAIPSVTPALANKYLKKTECFCFQEQPLAASESKSMPMIFYLDQAIPADLHTLTLSYTLYDITDRPTLASALAAAPAAANKSATSF